MAVRRAALSAEIPQIEQRRVERAGVEYQMASPATKYAEIWQLQTAINRWLDAFEDPEAVLENLARFKEASAYFEDLIEAGEMPAPRRKGDVFQAVNNSLDILRTKRSSASQARASEVQTPEQRQTYREHIAEVAAGRAQAKGVAVSALVTAAAHGHIGALRWVAYHLSTHQWDEVHDMNNTELWAVIANVLVGAVLASTPADELILAHDRLSERFADAGLTPPTW